MQASLVALVAALAGIVLDKFGGGMPFVAIIGQALIMGAFIIAVTVFLIFLKGRITGPDEDEITWGTRR